MLMAWNPFLETKTCLSLDIPRIGIREHPLTSQGLESESIPWHPKDWNQRASLDIPRIGIREHPLASQRLESESIPWHPKDWNQRASLDIPRKSATFMKSAFALIRCVILDWKWMLRRLLFIVSITSINIRLKDNCEIPCKSAASDWTFPLKRTLKVDSTF